MEATANITLLPVRARALADSLNHPRPVHVAGDKASYTLATKMNMNFWKYSDSGRYRVIVWNCAVCDVF